jgi:YHS domain-containing protein
MVRLFFYLFDLLIAMLAWRALGRVFQSLFGSPTANPFAPGARNSSRNAGASPAFHGETARDPLCGMFVSTELSHRLEQDGTTLHFCSRECLERFQKGQTTKWGNNLKL